MYCLALRTTGTPRSTRDARTGREYLSEKVINLLYVLWYPIIYIIVQYILYIYTVYNISYIVVYVVLSGTTLFPSPDNCSDWF